jgi:hypothetical protein
MKSVNLRLKNNFSMKIFTCDQIRKIDDYTIRYEPIASADLMERAPAITGEMVSPLPECFQ